jgi:hypothetical protein
VYRVVSIRLQLVWDYGEVEGRFCGIERLLRIYRLVVKVIAKRKESKVRRDATVRRKGDGYLSR